jgi:AAA+ superfamily predicted ATPase
MDDQPLGPFRAALSHLDARIAREIERLRARYQLSLDEFRGLYVSDEHVDALISVTTSDQRAPVRDTSAPLTTDLTDDPRWFRIVSTFSLSVVAQELLLLALAPELDLKYETLYAYLNDDVTRKWATASLAARLLEPTAQSRDVLHALAPASVLRTGRLIEPIDPPAGRPSQLNAGFAVTASVGRFLQRIPLTAFHGHADIDGLVDPWETLALSKRETDSLARVAALLAGRPGQPGPVVLSGPPGSGRWHAARAIARELRLPVRSLDLRSVRRAGASVVNALSDAALEVRLEPAVLCIHGLSALADADNRVAPEMIGALADVAALPVPVAVLATPAGPWRELLGGVRALVVELGAPDSSEQRQLWAEGLRLAGLALPDTDCRLLADRFQFTPAQVRDAVATARDWLTMRGDGAMADLPLVRDAARAQSRARLGSLAMLGTSPFSWDDLVLPPTTLSRLKELSAAIRLRHIVYSEWGFARRLSGALGIKALFGGPSGTGKTMAAGVIAREVGLDLLKVDLSGVVSKYIGETEKNLDRVFASARAGNALLFFDEADAIFGKRSEVKEAHDRYANIEVAYLLQKIEEHEGVVVLATNLRRNMDEAFSRRIHYTVDFPKPDVALRERLWREMVPREAPVATDVDFEFLARQFDLTGGDIRNVVLDAAFLSAQADQAIGMRAIVRALERQLGKQGKAPTSAGFRQYQCLLSGAAGPANAP